MNRADAGFIRSTVSPANARSTRSTMSQADAVSIRSTMSPANARSTRSLVSPTTLGMTVYCTESVEYSEKLVSVVHQFTITS